MATPPKGAKAPADRKPKTTEQDAQDDEFRDVEVDGRTFRVPTDALSDYRILRALRRAQRNEDASQLVDVLDMLLTEDAADEAMEHLASESGRIDPEAAFDFIGRLLEGLDPN